MSVADLSPANHSPSNHTTSYETFSSYLAKQLIAKKGFRREHVPEADALAAASDIVLTAWDGYTLTILCIIDREANPGKTFSLATESVRQIGESCLKYTRKTGLASRTKMPVFIRIVEVGASSPEQRERLAPFKRSSLTSKIIPSATVVDTLTGEVWSSSRTWFTKGAYHGFIENLLAKPREADSELVPPVVAVAPTSFPVLSTAIIALLVVIFAMEVALGPTAKALQPAVATLVAFGGLARSLVLQSGEWYRLFSAPFLHLDVGHLAMNSIALFIAGRRFENLVGRAWFGAVYVVAALGGSLLSLAVIPASIVSVGASGAIMGLFAAMIVVSMHFSHGPTRTGLQMSAMYVLIPSLLPLTGALQGQKVDYGAHFGGAIAGAIMGFVMLAAWPRTSPWPNLRRIAATVALAGVVVLAYPVIFVVRAYPTLMFATQLIPVNALPKNNAEWNTKARDLAMRYPQDPRAHLIVAGQLLDSNDRAGAEREARAGLAEENVWRLLLPEQLATSLKVVLAAAIATDRRDEAKTITQPICESTKDGPLRQFLDARKLCGT